MITADFICLLLLGAVIGVGGLVLLIFGLYTALTEHDLGFFFEMFFVFLFLFGLSIIISNEAYNEYQDAMPQNQVKILKQKISDAEKELQKYLIDHPELKEAEE